MPNAPTSDESVQDEKGTAAFDTFSGLRNTVSRTRLGPRELYRAENVDLSDAGQLSRRRGYRQTRIGRAHSLFQLDDDRALVVLDGVLCLMTADYKTVPLLAGIGPGRMSYIQVGDTIFFASIFNSGQLILPSLQVLPWGRVTGHTFQPGIDPAPNDWWYTPVATPDVAGGIGPVGGRLLGPPPLANALALYNGRIYLANGLELWATLPMNYQWVDKTAGYRYYEEAITAIGAVEDGLYVGTTKSLFFVEGVFGEEKRRIRAINSGVIPGTMVEAPGEIVTPEGRRRPDLPQQVSKALICMTHSGLVACLASGAAYNLTETSFLFPQSGTGSMLFRHQDGIHQMISMLDSGGTPRDNARIGDYVDATIVRAADVRAEPEITTASFAMSSGLGAPVATDDPSGGEVVTFYDTEGNVIFQGTEDD